MNDRGVERVEAAFRGIFERQYYANNGPLVREFDRAFADYTGARHAVAMVNESAALMVAALCLLPDGGEVIVPALAPPATSGALRWAGLTPVFADVDRTTLTLTADTAAPRVTRHTVGILGIHEHEHACDPNGLRSLADRHGLRLIFDATHTVGGAPGGRGPEAFGDAAVFSFREGSVLDAAEGASVTTLDDAIADQLRTARNFHASETFADVPLRMNAKLSEAQAALALLSLSDLPATIQANQARHARYLAAIGDLPGVRPHAAGALDVPPHACLTLRAEPGVVDRMPAGLRLGLNPMADGAGFPTTSGLCGRILQLPCGPSVTDGQIDATCAMLRSAELAHATVST